MRNKIMETIEYLKNQETTYDTTRQIPFGNLFTLEITVIRNGSTMPFMVEMVVIDKDGIDIDAFTNNIDNQVQIDDDIAYMMRCYYED